MNLSIAILATVTFVLAVNNLLLLLRISKAEQQQLRAYAMLNEALAKESREKDRLIRYLDRYIKEVAHTALPPDVWIRIERDASRMLEEG